MSSCVIQCRHVSFRVFLPVNILKSLTNNDKNDVSTTCGTCPRVSVKAGADRRADQTAKKIVSVLIDIYIYIYIYTINTLCYPSFFVANDTKMTYNDT